MPEAAVAARIGLFQRIRFLRQFTKTAQQLKQEKFKPADAEEGCQEVLKRMIAVEGDDATELRATVGADPVGEPGPFIQLLLQFFTKMMESSLLVTIIKSIFGL